MASIKGKRTKRQRSTSPFRLPATDNSSSTGDDNYNSMSYPTTSGETTEEEEDMANCLILLAQSGDGDQHRERRRNRNNSGGEEQKIQKEAAGGLYAYECKTCSRCFPSFQALGGHRAGHKRPKAVLLDAAVPEKKSAATAAASVTVLPSRDDYSINHYPQTHLQLAAANKLGNKIHECSICGSEFTSGQALGGHMRRHRAAAVSKIDHSTPAVTVALAAAAARTTTTTRSILPLDLNLPAPEDHDHHHHHHHIRFGSTQQPPLVFSATPALVDCHY